MRMRKNSVPTAELIESAAQLLSRANEYYYITNICAANSTRAADVIDVAALDELQNMIDGLRKKHARFQVA